MIGIRTNTSPPDHLAHYRAQDGSELRVVCGQFLHRSHDGGAWLPVPMFALADVFQQARADEHAATDTGYDGASEMLAVAGDAAARTLAAIR